eukprot:1767820-Prymnesium_polylepis.1
MADSALRTSCIVLCSAWFSIADHALSFAPSIADTHASLRRRSEKRLTLRHVTAVRAQPVARERVPRRVFGGGGACARTRGARAPLRLAAGLQLDLALEPKVDHKHVVVPRVDGGAQHLRELDRLERLAVAQARELLRLVVLELAARQHKISAAVVFWREISRARSKASTLRRWTRARRVRSTRQTGTLSCMARSRARRTAFARRPSPFSPASWATSS